MRAVIDHHVDRPDVDAQQCVKLTGTNRSIGLISHIACSDKQMSLMLAPTRERANCKTIGTTGYFIYSMIECLGSEPRRAAHAQARASTRSRAGANIKQSIFFFDDLVVIARG